MRRPDLKQALLGSAAALWLTLVTCGMAALWAYAGRPGAQTPPPPQWPETSAVLREAGRPALVMFVHPRCPCTLASLAELGRLMPAIHRSASVHVLVSAPGGLHGGEKLWDQASAIPGVVVRHDPGGQEARRFGVQTSGAVVLYDAAGRLAFHGGITGSRGHEGACDGTRAVRAVVDGSEPLVRSTPVYGCGLFDPAPPQTCCANPEFTPPVQKEP